MTIDIKRLLYKFKQLIEAKRNAEISLKILNERQKRLGTDENWWIRGTGQVRIPLEDNFIFEETTMRKIEYLETLIAELTNVIEAIQRAVNTLNKEQGQLIQFRYFEDNNVVYVCEEMRVSEYKYFHIHKIALESLSICLTALYFDEAHLDRLIFSPLKERYDATKTRRETKENPKRNQSFTAS